MLFRSVRVCVCMCDPENESVPHVCKCLAGNAVAAATRIIIAVTSMHACVYVMRFASVRPSVMDDACVG